MRLLFVTQKLHDQDRFAVLWINEFRRQGFDVTAVCLENRSTNLPFQVSSMGKERGNGKLRQVLTYWRLIATLKYDRVFIHMAPVYGALGAWYWPFKKIPVYLWYTHYKKTLSLRILTRFAKRFFCASEASLPMFAGDPRKVVTGHGIDLAFWTKRANAATNPHALLVVHRLCRSKHLDVGFRALALLPERYTMTIYGAPLEKDYVAELHALASALKISHRVSFKGTVPMTELPAIFASHRILFNFAGDTIDKTMVEALSCGMWVVTSAGNAASIGLSKAPTDDAPATIAGFIERCTVESVDPDKTYRVLVERHDLKNMVRTMASYMLAGH